LSHSAGTSVSGFPGYERGTSIPSTLQVLEGEAPANTDPVRVLMTPGEKFQYSGGGTTIVQQLIEDVTNTPFQTWMKENVLDPLGMNSSTYEQPFSETSAPLATHGHLQNGKEVEGYWHIYPEMAAAGLWTTSSDLATFLISFQSILSADIVQEMLKPQMLISGSFYTGLGVFIRQNANGFTFEHLGLDHGFSARAYMLPDQDQGFVMMTNADANGWYLMEEAMNSVSDVYHWPNAAPIERIGAISDPIAHRALIGRYHLVEYSEEILDIYAENENLFVRHNHDMPAMQLHFEKEGQYFTKEENQTLSFNRKSDDTIELTIRFDDDQIFGQIFLYTKE
jgi:CubicO group peptidase (beta-lactamase class C family)